MLITKLKNSAGSQFNSIQYQKKPIKRRHNIESNQIKLF